MSNGDRKNGPVPATVTSIPLVDPHAPKADPSIGDLVNAQLQAQRFMIEQMENYISGNLG